VDLNAINHSSTALMDIVSIGLHEATFPTKEHAKVAELLLSKGADLYIKDWFGETALDKARKNAEACKEVLEVFERYHKKGLSD